MKTIFSSKRDRCLSRVSIFLTTVALIIGMVGCNAPSAGVEIRDWHDLDAVRNNLDGEFLLMNDLDSTNAGYAELASPTANGGKGWQPIGSWPDVFSGSFDGQGYEIRDLFISRPDESEVGFFSRVDVGGTINNISVINATVSGSDLVGGLAGGSNNGTVSNSYFDGRVSGRDRVGGLVGYNNFGTVSNSYSTGSVTGNSAVGGLVGNNYGGIVSNSYSTDSVTGNSTIGGLVGYNYGTVSNSYSTGSVTGNSTVGGLVGDNSGSGTVSNSFWDTETSGQSTSDGGTGKTAAEMQNIATFSGVGWNIIAVAPGETITAYIWNIVDDETYPFLSWQPV